jgi:hypothetical protein
MGHHLSRHLSTHHLSRHHLSIKENNDGWVQNTGSGNILIMILLSHSIADECCLVSECIMTFMMSV